MSYHDKHLSLSGTAAKNSLRRSMLRGIGLLSLTPRSPTIRFGSVEGDWRAVGGDMRRAMQRIHAE